MVPDIPFGNHPGSVSNGHATAPPLCWLLVDSKILVLYTNQLDLMSLR
jgi:hypothetical protein